MTFLLSNINLFSSVANQVENKIIEKRDSLNMEISKCESDSNKAQLYFELSRQYDYFKSKERIDYLIEAVRFSKQSQNSQLINKHFTALINILSHRKMDDVAMEYSMEYIQYLEKNKLVEDLSKFYKAYANILSSQKKYKVARVYYDKAYIYYKSKKDYLNIANVYNNISIIFLNTGLYDSALVYNSMCSEIFKYHKDTSAYANSLLGYSEIMLKKNNIELANNAALSSLSLYKKTKNNLGIANSNFVIGEINYKIKDYSKAIGYFNEAINFAQLINFMNIKRDAYLSLAECQSLLSNFKGAYFSQKRYKEINDSILKEEVESKILEMEVKYDISRKEEQIKKNELELRLKNKQQNIMFLMIAGILLLFLIVFFAYTQKRKINKLVFEQKRLVEERQKEIIDSIKYAQRIQTSQLPSERHIESTLNRLKKIN